LGLSEPDLDIIFRSARSHNAWTVRPVSLKLLQAVYDLAKLGPTSANTCPLRIAFVTTPEAKARLLAVVSEGNVEKTRTAPVVALFAYDTEFYEQLPKLFPHRDLRPVFAGNPELASRSAILNSSLQAAYFMIAARSLGLDCGPMGGFDAERLNREFFPVGKWKINFICALGHGDPAGLRPRLPRLVFDEACVVM
jgi:nitroreductase